NAHDHLELNHYPRTKYRERYDNSSEWSRDMNAHLNFSPFKELRAYPLDDRCFIGGLKNLLSGVTTVIHHNPPHKILFRKNFPVRVVKHYYWAHSLYLSSETEIAIEAQRARKKGRFFIHLAEGTDEEAAGEYQRLKAMGGIVPSRTVLIHCVGVTRDDLADAVDNLLSGVIWCPSTNLYLLGKTIDLDMYWWDTEINVNAMGLGSDSRLTADGDFLDEMRAARQIVAQQQKYSDYDQRKAIFMGNAFYTGIEELYGYLKIGAPADWIALQRDKDILNIRRADLALVVRGGEPQIGDPDLMLKFPHIETIRARLDDTEKRINVKLARQIARCTLHEPGLELLEVPSEFSFTRFWNGVRKP
ncbi:MAG: hypothetical protein ABI700_30510, partial [Chloroflexota bacterium]